MERHDLIHEFPEYQDKIHQLKVEDTHFRKIFDEYHELEHRIHNINTGEEIGDINLHGIGRLRPVSGDRAGKA